jgi:hypothetical protein
VTMDWLTMVFLRSGAISAVMPIKRGSSQNRSIATKRGMKVFGSTLRNSFITRIIAGPKCKVISKVISKGPTQSESAIISVWLKYSTAARLRRVSKKQ